jgi:hypothetical protein
MTLKIAVATPYSLTRSRGCPKTAVASCGINYRGL